MVAILLFRWELFGEMRNERGFSIASNALSPLSFRLFFVMFLQVGGIMIPVIGFRNCRSGFWLDRVCG